jgi:hypothetical protein
MSVKNHIIRKKPMTDFTRPTKCFIAKLAADGTEVLEDFKLSDESLVTKLTRYALHVIVKHNVIVPKCASFELDFRLGSRSAEVPYSLVTVHLKLQDQVRYTLHDVKLLVESEKIIGHQEITVYPIKFD